jgi:hypothetical protein
MVGTGNEVHFLLNGIKAQYESKISMLKTIPHKK